MSIMLSLANHDLEPPSVEVWSHESIHSCRQPDLDKALDLMFLIIGTDRCTWHISGMCQGLRSSAEAEIGSQRDKVEEITPGH
jgi:hypothetical protein